MTLSRSQVVDAAIMILDQYGLGSLSMRHLANELHVQPGALYWHVKSKQDLLAAIAERILAPTTATASSENNSIVDARSIAIDFRAALLRHRDGAEIVSFAQALTRTPLPIRQRLQDALGHLGDTSYAAWGAAALTHFVIGAANEEQNRAELARAGLVAHEAPGVDADSEFLFGVDAIVQGITQFTVYGSKDLL